MSCGPNQFMVLNKLSRYYYYLLSYRPQNIDDIEKMLTTERDNESNLVENTSEELILLTR